jgi:hypothetical protein
MDSRTCTSPLVYVSMDGLNILKIFNISQGIILVILLLYKRIYEPEPSDSLLLKIVQNSASRREFHQAVPLF